MIASMAALKKKEGEYLGKIHCCNQLNERNSVLKRVATYTIFKDDEQWIFSHESRAIEEDVENGEAEEVGEFMTGGEFVVYFCPFCGEKL